ncbi:hypothetical protein BBO99_00008926 [Phytophthora kernoviae]|uniref:Uncharacterized protein n=2 Tax=Phytophthora kernoviae TaxID=325452 RepID=A0A3R7JU58_9STRA|nr:hypothetical protein G195_010444 [Phytophthora kernoviae 00238/432]KAG2508657.1 hypothetical protein JM16_008777 [Phytophthora kernoviae]KAG2510822.1 hypothetical protein JM18_008804 [Phytophthora kernoviae]RLN14696.1 hypothetical protein BBI17_008511 [Phytophthora kernoviae]RLN74455.1 hypothetical protein BBO99_00008926 [Phytophthora kernoviae]
MATPSDEPKDPFDAKQSDREPFPSFEAALADAGGADERESALNWSIDTLAELKPVSFSPLAEQKTASALETPSGASGFFEDETHPPKKVMVPTRSSIPRRQQAFMAAIEAEASKSQSRASLGVTVASPPLSILSLYQKAKRLGMSDPQVQWEYAQRLRHGDDRHTRKHKR